jgi:hypothetical protein
MQWLRAWTGTRGAAARAGPPRPLALDTIRCQMVRAVRGCSEPHRARAADKVMAAGCATELWLLRCDLYQYLAHDLGQAEAQRRVEGLQALFEGHVARPSAPPVH